MTGMDALASSLSGELGLPVELRPSPNASNFVMRMDPRSRSLRVTLPPGARPGRVEAFLREHEGWIRRQAAKIPERVRFVTGAVVPVLGVDRTIRQDTAQRFPARLATGENGPEIVVGRTDYVETKVMALLKDEAARALRRLTQEKAAAIGKVARDVSVKDTSSRWGSCAPSGDIAYSWRLVMAPPEIVDYLAAHEVAHLAELNHGARFWRICRSLSGMCPDRAQSWLTLNGARLMRYGPD